MSREILNEVESHRLQEYEISFKDFEINGQVTGFQFLDTHTVLLTDKSAIFKVDLENCKRHTRLDFDFPSPIDSAFFKMNSSKSFYAAFFLGSPDEAQTLRLEKLSYVKDFIRASVSNFKAPLSQYNTTIKTRKILGPYSLNPNLILKTQFVADFKPSLSCQKVAFTRNFLVFLSEDNQIKKYDLAKNEVSLLLNRDDHKFKKVIEMKASEPLKVIYFSTSDCEVGFVSYQDEKVSGSVYSELSPILQMEVDSRSKYLYCLTASTTENFLIFSIDSSEGSVPVHTKVFGHKLENISSICIPDASVVLYGTKNGNIKMVWLSSVDNKSKKAEKDSELALLSPKLSLLRPQEEEKKDGASFGELKGNTERVNTYGSQKSEGMELMFHHGSGNSQLCVKKEKVIWEPPKSKNKKRKYDPTDEASKPEEPKEIGPIWKSTLSNRLFFKIGADEYRAMDFFEIDTFIKFPSTPSAFGISQNKEYLVVGFASGEIKSYELMTQEVLDHENVFDSPVTAVAVSNCGKIVLACSEKNSELALSNLSNRNKNFKMANFFSKPVDELHWSDYLNLCVAKEEKIIKVLDVDVMELMAFENYHGDEKLLGLELCDNINGSMMSYSKGKIKIFNLNPKKLAYDSDVPESPVEELQRRTLFDLKRLNPSNREELNTKTQGILTMWASSKKTLKPALDYEEIKDEKGIKSGDAHIPQQKIDFSNEEILQVRFLTEHKLVCQTKLEVFVYHFLTKMKEPIGLFRVGEERPIQSLIVSETEKKFIAAQLEKSIIVLSYGEGNSIEPKPTEVNCVQKKKMMFWSFSGERESIIQCTLKGVKVQNINKGQAPESVSLFHGSLTKIEFIDVSKDGKKLSVLYENGRISIYDLVSATLLGSIEREKSTIEREFMSMARSNVKDRIITYSENEVSVFTTSGDKTVFTKPTSGVIAFYAYKEDSIFVGMANRFWIYPLIPDERSLVHHFQQGFEAVIIEVSHNFELVAVSYENKDLEVFSFNLDQQAYFLAMRVPSVMSNSMTALAISDNLRLVSVGSAGSSIKVYNVLENHLDCFFKNVHEGIINCIEFQSSQVMFSTGEDQKVNVYDLNNKLLICKIKVFNNIPVKNMRVLPVICGGAKSILVYTTYSFKVLRFQKTMEWEMLDSEFDSLMFGKSYSQENKVAILTKASASFKGSDNEDSCIVSCYNEATNQTKTIKTLKTKPRGLILTKELEIITWNQRGDVTIYHKANQGELSSSSIPHYTPTEFPLLLSFTPKFIRVLAQEKLVFVSNDTEILLLNFETRKTIATMNTTCVISAIEVGYHKAQKGKSEGEGVENEIYLVWGDEDGMVYLSTLLTKSLELENNSVYEFQKENAHEFAVKGFAFSNELSSPKEGRLTRICASYSRDRSISLYNMESCEFIGKLSKFLRNSHISAALFSDDNKILFVATTEPSILLFCAKNFSQIMTIKNPGIVFEGMNQIITACNGCVLLLSSGGRAFGKVNLNSFHDPVVDMMVTYNSFDLNNLLKLKEEMFAFNPRIRMSFLSYVAIKKIEKMEARAKNYNQIHFKTKPSLNDVNDVPLINESQNSGSPQLKKASPFDSRKSKLLKNFKFSVKTTKSKKKQVKYLETTESELEEEHLGHSHSASQKVGDKHSKESKLSIIDILTLIFNNDKYFEMTQSYVSSVMFSSKEFHCWSNLMSEFNESDLIVKLSSGLFLPKKKNYSRSPLESYFKSGMESKRNSELSSKFWVTFFPNFFTRVTPENSSEIVSSKKFKQGLVFSKHFWVGVASSSKIKGKIQNPNIEKCNAIIYRSHLGVFAENFLTQELLFLLKELRKVSVTHQHILTDEKLSKLIDFYWYKKNFKNFGILLLFWYILQVALISTQALLINKRFERMTVDFVLWIVIIVLNTTSLAYEIYVKVLHIYTLFFLMQIGMAYFFALFSLAYYTEDDDNKVDDWYEILFALLILMTYFRLIIMTRPIDNLRLFTTYIFSILKSMRALFVFVLFCGVFFSFMLYLVSYPEQDVREVVEYTFKLFYSGFKWKDSTSDSDDEIREDDWVLWWTYLFSFFIIIVFSLVLMNVLIWVVRDAIADVNKNKTIIDNQMKITMMLEYEKTMRLFRKLGKAQEPEDSFVYLYLPEKPAPVVKKPSKTGQLVEKDKSASSPNVSEEVEETLRKISGLESTIERLLTYEKKFLAQVKVNDRMTKALKSIIDQEQAWKVKERNLEREILNGDLSQSEGMDNSQKALAKEVTRSEYSQISEDLSKINISMEEAEARMKKLKEEVADEEKTKEELSHFVEFLKKTQDSKELEMSKLQKELEITSYEVKCLKERIPGDREGNKEKEINLLRTLNEETSKLKGRNIVLKKVMAEQKAQIKKVTKEISTQDFFREKIQYFKETNEELKKQYSEAVSKLVKSRLVGELFGEGKERGSQKGRNVFGNKLFERAEMMGQNRRTDTQNSPIGRKANMEPIGDDTDRLIPHLSENRRVNEEDRERKNSHHRIDPLEIEFESEPTASPIPGFLPPRKTPEKTKL